MIDYDYAVAASKVRKIVFWDVCKVPNWIYSKKAVGETNVPFKIQACVLDQYTDSGYVCGNKVTVEGLYAQEKLFCSDTIGKNYYNPSFGKKGGGIVTKGVCYVW